MTSSLEGAGPVGAHIPLRTYSGDVPMSEYMIPVEHELYGAATVGLRLTQRLEGEGDESPSPYADSRARGGEAFL